MSFFGNTINTLQQSIDYATLKQQTISNNIANADTPNYKAKTVSFQNVLNEQMSSSFKTKRTHPKHLTFEAERTTYGSVKITTDNSTAYNHNGNNVDIDKEMTELAKNQIYYQGLIDRLNGKFNSLQTVIKGGR